MTSRREALPNRRYCETFDVEFGGFNRNHTITAGYYPDGRIGEVFINGGKSGEQVESIARDGAVLLSLALQYGTPMETIAKTLTRDSSGVPGTIVGAVVDALRQGGGE
jgi:hypothetical protein